MRERTPLFACLSRAFGANGGGPEVERAPEFPVRHAEPLGVDRSLKIWSAKQRPSRIVEWLAIHLGCLPPGEFERAPAQRLKAHRRLWIEVRFERQSQNRPPERLHIAIPRPPPALSDLSIFQVRL